MEQIRDLLGRVKLFCRLEVAIVKQLEEYERRIYKLEENRKVKDAAIAQLQKDVSQLTLILRQGGGSHA